MAVGNAAESESILTSCNNRYYDLTTNFVVLYASIRVVMLFFLILNWPNFIFFFKLLWVICIVCQHVNNYSISFQITCLWVMTEIASSTQS